MGEGDPEGDRVGVGLPPDGHGFGLELGLDDGLPDGLPTGHGDPLGEPDGLGDAEGELLADADALGLPLAEALPEGVGSGHIGRSGSISQGSTWACAALIVCLLRLASTGESVAIRTTQQTSATRAGPLCMSFLRNVDV